MRLHLISCHAGLIACACLGAPSASAQALPTGAAGVPVPGDPGISAMWNLLDDSGYSVARDYAEPGATRRMHNHPEFSYHLFILLSGTLRVTIEGKAPREVHAGEVLQIPAGATHGFTNTGTVTATIVEVFGKPRDRAAAPLPAPSR